MIIKISLFIICMWILLSYKRKEKKDDVLLYILCLEMVSLSNEKRLNISVITIN